MAIKEEAYDPGYEDAYGGAYVEGGPEGGPPPGEPQTNGHCNFSAAENPGEVERRERWTLMLVFYYDLVQFDFKHFHPDPKCRGTKGSGP